MPINPPSTTLDAIQTKVRRLTRSPSTAQLDDQTLQDYINTFVMYDFPEHLRLISFKTNLTWFCSPNIDTYQTNTTNPTDPLYNFKNQYLSVNPPMYIGGYQAFYSQSQEQFYGIYPRINFVQSLGVVGDGVTTLFTGTIPNAPFLQNQVLFDSVDTNGNGLTLIDFPTSATSGNLIIPDDPSTGAAFGTVNYLTGAFTVLFPGAPGSGQPINSQTVPYQPAQPQSILFFDEKFVLRPVPDQPYRIEMEAFIRPTALLASNQSPQLEEMWQYIAYGAARKVFQDRMDLESLALIEPEYKLQERLVLRRTIVQQTVQRTPTIYTEQLTGNGNGPGYFYGYGGF